MNFLTSIWIFQVFGIVMIAISESTVIKEPQSPITAFYGDTVFFNWTSNKSLDVVTWGIRSGNSASPQYIYVDSRGPVVKPTLDADLKRRIHYNGSLTAGRAWFSISHVNANDSNWYIGIIREQGSSTNYYYVQLIVAPLTTPTPTPTPTSSTLPVSSSSPSPSLSSTTTKHPTTSPPPKKLRWWHYLLIGIFGSLFLVTIILIGCCCCCLKLLKDCYRCLCCCCPCKDPEECYDRLCCCCPWKMKGHGSSEEHGSEMKS